jgi:hypothetical protein
MNRETRRELVVFVLLLAFGVLGRWAQPAWNFTPLAAIAALGGYYFRSWLPAVLLPWTMLIVSDTMLAPHDNLVAAASVFVITLLPVAMGRAARGAQSWGRVALWAMCGFVPATAFFLVTNFAVWASKSLYAPTLDGLGQCYAYALPFYRTMLAGDVCYVALAAACLGAAHMLDARTLGAEQVANKPSQSR